MNEMMPEVGAFATTGTLNEDFLRRNAKPLMRKAVLAYSSICMTTAILSAYLYTKAGGTHQLIVALLLLMMAIWYPWYYNRRWLKTSIARLKESSPDGEMVVTVSCTEQGIRIENQTSGGAMTINYENINCAIETEDALLIRSRANQLTAFFKSSLTEQECTDLKAFLLNKGVKVKSL